MVNPQVAFLALLAQPQIFPIKKIMKSLPRILAHLTKTPNFALELFAWEQI